MIKPRQLKVFLILLGSFVNGCASGLKAQVCIVDAAHLGFQCAGQNIKSHFVLFEDGRELQCASPKDSEEFLKQCKEHKVLPIDMCSYDGASFLCTTPQGDAYRLLYQDADNYMCLSAQDFRRLRERCN